MSITLYKTFLQIIFLAFVISFALSVNYLYAAVWQGPPAGTPPANNVDSPINVGTTNQVKDANLSVGHSANTASDYGLISYGRLRTTIGGVEFPDGTVQTTAAASSVSNAVNYSPVVSGVSWQQINISGYNATYGTMGAYACSQITTVTLNAGNGVADSSKAAIVSFYTIDSEEDSPGFKLYDMSNVLQGATGRAGRGGDGRGYGSGGEMAVKLTNRQFKIQICRSSPATFVSVVNFAAKGVIN